MTHNPATLRNNATTKPATTQSARFGNFSIYGRNIEKSPRHPIARARRLLAKQYSVAVAFGLLGSMSADAQRKDREIIWERDDRTLIEQKESPIARYRFIEPPRDLIKNGQAQFGRALQLIQPTAEMARVFKLDPNYESQLYAWVGAPAVSVSKRKYITGAIVLLNFNTGKEYATIGSPEELPDHGFGFGLKLSSDGKYLGIESAGGPAAILNQNTGKVILLKHSDFHNYILNKDGTTTLDTREQGTELKFGSRLEFLPDNKIIVCGIYGLYSNRSDIKDRQNKFHIFDSEGNHIQPIASPTMSYATPHYCFGTTGAKLHLNQSTNTLYFISSSMYDPIVKKIGIVLGDEGRIGRLGAFDVGNQFKELPFSLFPDAEVSESARSRMRFAEEFAIVGDKIVLSHKGANESYSPETAGKLSVHSIAMPTPTDAGQIKIGEILGESIEVTSITAINQKKFLIAYRTRFSDERGGIEEGIFKISSFGICDIETLSFQKIEGFEVDDSGSAGIRKLLFNPHNRTGLLVGIPSYNGEKGMIMELDFKPEFFDN